MSTFYGVLDDVDESVRKMRFTEILPNAKDVGEKQKSFIEGGNMLDASRLMASSVGAGQYSPSDSLFSEFPTTAPSSMANNQGASTTFITATPSSTTTENKENQFLKAERDRIAKQRTSRDYTRDDFFSIGTVYLSIPPTQIQVSNEMHNYRYSPLRSQGEIILSSGRSTTRIELDIVFNGYNDINNKLRVIMAQFKTTPFLPVESSYLRGILNPFDRSLVDTEYRANLGQQLNNMKEADAAVKDMLDLSAQKSQQQAALQSGSNFLLKKGYITPDFYTAMNAYIRDPEAVSPQFVTPEDYEKNQLTGKDELVLSKWVRRNVIVPGGSQYDINSVERSLTEMDNVKEVIHGLDQKAMLFNTKGMDERYRDRQMVCVLSQISLSTNPGFPETISCRLSLYVFNYDPFTNDFSFISGNNNKDVTPDLTKCSLFIDWYTKRWLVDSTDIFKPSLVPYNGDQSFTITYFSKISPVPYNGIYTKDQFKTASLKFDKNTIITGMSASLKNIIQFIPVLSCKNPTCHYMGSMNNELQVTIECTSQSSAQEISKMVDAVNNISRNQNRVARFNYICINSNFVDFFGMKFFTVDNYTVDTVPGSPGLYLIGLNLTEYRAGQESNESLVREGVTSYKEIEAVAKYALEQAHAYAINPVGDRYYFDKVMRYSNGWLGGDNVISRFYNGVGGDSLDNKQLRVSIERNSDTTESWRVIENSIQASMHHSIVSGAVDQLIAGGGASVAENNLMTYVSKENLFLPEPAVPNIPDIDGFQAKFVTSLRMPDDSSASDFYKDNVDLVAKVLAIMKRDDIVSMILVDDQRSKLESLLNNAEDGQGSISKLNASSTDGKKLRSKADLDAGKVYCYPDLDLPNYGELTDGYKYKITMAQNGTPSEAQDRHKSIQSDNAEVDPDFYFYRGSLWGFLDKDPVANDTKNYGIMRYKGLAASNREHRRTETLAEPIAAQFLAETRKFDTEDQLYTGQIPTDPTFMSRITERPHSVVSVYNGNTISINDGVKDITVNDGGKESTRQAQKNLTIRIAGYQVRGDGNDLTQDSAVTGEVITDPNADGNSPKNAKDLLASLVSNKVVNIFPTGGEKDKNGTTEANVSWVEPSGEVKWVHREMLRFGQRFGVTPYMSDVNPLSEDALKTYNSVRELSVKRFKDSQLATNIANAGFMIVETVGAMALAAGVAATTPVSVPVALTAAGLSAAVITNSANISSVLGNSLNIASSFFNTKGKSSAALSTESTEQVLAFTSSVLHTVPALEQAFVPENIITNNIDDDLAKLASTPTNNRGLARFDRESGKNIDVLSDKIRESQKDDTLRISRAFPTFKLYFMEEDMPEWGRLDDAYSYHAVSSIDITKSRQEAADVAVITLFNTRGVLDRSVFGIYSADGTYFQTGPVENYEPKNQETRNEQDLQEFVLKPGTVIKIKMGYSSDPDILDTVFTGMVAEVSGGDMMTIVAQGFGVELMQPVPFISKNISTDFTAKLLNDIIKHPAVKHFGKTEWFPRTDDTSKAVYRRYQYNSKTQNWESKAWWRRIGGINYILRLRDDTRDNNIWLQEEGWWYSFTHSGFQSVTLKDMSIWDTFREMQRRMPGYIAAVLPFDNRSTIYFGPSDFMYTYTSMNKDALRMHDNALADQVRRDPQDKIKSMADEGRLARLGWSDLEIQAINLTQDLRDLRSKDRTAYTKLSPLFNGSTNAEEIKVATDYLSTTAQSLQPNTPEGKATSARFDFLAKTFKESKNNPFSIKEGSTNAHFGAAMDFMVDVKPETLNSGDLKNAFYITPDANIMGHDDAIDYFDKTASDLSVLSNPSRKLVKNYHYKDSFHHIVANNIVSTSKYLYNKITVEYGGSRSWIGNLLFNGTAGYLKVSALVDDDIWPNRIKEKIVQEKNAVDIVTAWHYALGNLHEEFRKMYEGHLTILGDPTIKPNDVIMVSDFFTDMFGPIEVEQVTHHFSSETGFVTTIVPNLVCSVNNPLQNGSLTVAGSYMDATSKMVAKWKGSTWWTGPIISNYFGRLAFYVSSFNTNRREPISFTPLIYAGRPYVAGVEGMRKNSIIEHWGSELTLFKTQLKRIVDTASGIGNYVGLKAAANGPSILKAAETEFAGKRQ